MRAWRTVGLFLLIAGCSNDETGTGGSCEGDSDCTNGLVCRNDVCVDGNTLDAGALDVGTQPTLQSILLEPSSADLVSTDGSKPEQRFTVVGVYSDGSQAPAMGSVFSLDTQRIGDIDVANGRFVANGVFGGSATVRVTAQNLEATAAVTVRIERSHLGSGVPVDVADRFNTQPISDPARAAQIVYPLQGAVMPQNVFPANVQWLVGTQGDIFRIRLTKPSVSVTAYVIHSGGGFTNSWLVDQDSWSALAATDPDDDAAIVVDRWQQTTGDVITTDAVSMRFARAAVAGSVYYWDITTTRIMRINDGTNQADSFMPNPPTAVDNNNCIGCHSVSTSGRYMAGRLGGGNNIGGVFDLTKDLTLNPVPTEFPVVVSPPSQKWWFSSWNPEDTRLVLSVDESTPSGSLKFFDPFTGQVVPVTGPMPNAGGNTHPAWSPDGTAIAYVANANTWGGDNVTGDIALLPVTGLDTVDNPVVIHNGADLNNATPAGVADSYPTWTPDSSWLVFAHGSSSRSQDGEAALYIVKRDGTNVRRLDNASGGPNTDDTFQPNASLFHQGGYFWISYLSRRDYGNELAGTRGSRRHQIWVSAIEDTPQGGQDPSEVGYWLPGQSTSSSNISAFWAPRACRADGEPCSVGTECCGGDCRPDQSGNLVCSPPPPERCREQGETCSTTADCCDDLECIARVCFGGV